MAAAAAAHFASIAASLLDAAALDTVADVEAMSAMPVFAQQASTRSTHLPKSCLKRDAPLLEERAPKRCITIAEESNDVLLFVSPYEEDRLSEWFYQEEDFEEFENDARGKKKKKKVGGGGKRRRPPPAPAKKHEPDLVTPDDLATMAGVIFPAACGARNVNVQQQLDDQASASALPPAKRRMCGATDATMADVSFAAIAAPSAALPPTLTTPMTSFENGSGALTTHDPLAAAAAAAAAAAVGLAPRRARSTEPPPIPPPMPPPTLSAADWAEEEWAGKAPAALAVSAAPTMRTRGRSQVRLLSEVNELGVEELKQKIRDVASARRERLQHGVPIS